jgi:GT2 family glycosyltransferase
MNQMPKVSIIIPTWNGITYIQDCLNSLLDQAYPDFEVIVVDNASSDGTPDWVAKHYPQVILIRNERNLGFAGGVNVGLAAASGNILGLLNQDTSVQSGWLGALVEVFLAETSIGIVGSKTLYPDGTIQHAGGYVDQRGEGSHYGYREKAAGQFDQSRSVDFVTGAALAIARPALKAIGRLDEGFSPAYYEDVDWCFRAREAGFQVVYAPKAVLIHKEASRAAAMSHDRMYLFHRNRLRFVFKHWPVNRLTDEFLPAERAWLESLGVGSEQLIAAMHHAYLHHLLHLADVVAWRQELLGASFSEADTLAEVLLSLRTVIPLRPARLAEQGETTDDWAWLLEELHRRWNVLEQPTHSPIPWLDPLIVAVRYIGDRIFAWPVIKRQIEFNFRVTRVLDQLEHDRRRLAEYVGENGREVAELAREIQRLQSLQGTQSEK